MIVSLAHLTPVFTAALAYKYLTELGQSPQGTGSYISLHKYTAAITSIPHHVLIVYSTLFCSGSLVRSRIVVTSASCFKERETSAAVLVKVGASVVTGLGQVIEAAEIKIHEYFGQNSKRNNDIAVMVLKENVLFGTDVKKIMLIQPETALRPGTSLDVSGWGSQNLKAQYVNALLWSEMIVMAREECNKVYPLLITSSNFCVRYQPERRLSDNGGPAEYNGLLVGVLSFGAAKSYEPFVAVLTNVSYFNRWINLNSERLLKKYCMPSIDKSAQNTDRDESYSM